MFGADRAKANTSKSGRRKRMRESESKEREREKDLKNVFWFWRERVVGPKVFFPPVKIQVKLYPTNIKIKIGWISDRLCDF